LSIKKKIAIIIPGGIGTGKNNIGVPVLERIVLLLAKDFDIVVFSLFNINNDYQPSGFELISVNASNIISRSLKLFLLFRAANRKQKFNVIHGFWILPSGFFAVLLGKIFKIKSVVSILGGDAVSLPEINYGQLRKWLPRKLVFQTLRNADEVISLTNYLVDNLTRAGFKRNIIHIIPWGIDIKLFPFCDRPFSGTIQFLHIGNLNAVKDQETLLKAFRLITEKISCHLTIIGEGPMEDKVKRLVDELSLKEGITFKGLIPYEDLPQVYRQADILLHTSLSEGQCEVVTEAMSSGVIVCGTKVGLMYDLTECCIAVSVKDFTALAVEVLKLLKENERMKNIKRNAFNWTTAHSISWTVSEISKLYLK
jgi:glycosyltransferase involved in cell wall biosynthesis